MEFFLSNFRSNTPNFRLFGTHIWQHSDRPQLDYKINVEGIWIKTVLVHSICVIWYRSFFSPLVLQMIRKITFGIHCYLYTNKIWLIDKTVRRQLYPYCQRLNLNNLCFSKYICGWDWTQWSRDLVMSEYRLKKTTLSYQMVEYSPGKIYNIIVFPPISDKITLTSG